jgi:prolipoprotein diacylglyceryltransferase
MLPILQIGPLSLPTAAFLLLIGFWLALELTEKQAPIFKIAPTPIYIAVLAAVAAGIIGARLAYAARSPDAFLQSPLSLLSLTPQMLDPIGGLAAAALTILIAIRITKMPLWPTLDALTTLLAVLAVALGLAHFASGDAFGTPTGLPWAIQLWGEQRHPSQIYETLAALAAAALVWPGRRAVRYSQAHPGFRFWVFLGISAGSRLLLETFRGDSLLWMNSFRAPQVIAWLVLAVSLWQIGRRLAAPQMPLSPQEISVDT